MKINIHSNIELDDKFQEYLNKKVEKLEKFIFDEGNADIYIKKDGPFYISEIDIKTKKHTIFLKEKEKNISKCIDLLITKTKRKLTQLHDIVIDRSKK